VAELLRSLRIARAAGTTVVAAVAVDALDRPEQDVSGNTNTTNALAHTAVATGFTRILFVLLIGSVRHT
jgi:hypothetical protein